MVTVDGIVHAPNLPTEEVFTCPALSAWTAWCKRQAPVHGRRVDRGAAGAVRERTGGRDRRGQRRRHVAHVGGAGRGAARLGEVALVDRESRVGTLDRVFFDTLLDENAASHIALGQGIALAVEDGEDRERINTSQIHIDFMIGSDELAITGITNEGREVPLPREGAWQI